MKLPKLPKRDTLGAFEGVSVFQRWQTLLSTVSCANGLQLAKKMGKIAANPGLFRELG